MSVLVTVTKNQLVEKNELTDQLLSLSRRVTDAGTAYIFEPVPGLLIDFIGLLGEHSVMYNIHSNMDTDMLRKFLSDDDPPPAH
jgi:hypothetical protein